MIKLAKNWIDDHRSEGSRLSSLYKNKLKPEMVKQHQSICKVSKRVYSFLKASYFVTLEGKYFRHLHEKPIGRGVFKDVYPLGIISGDPPMVRAVYRTEKPLCGDDLMYAFCHRYRDHPNILSGHYLVYTSQKTKKVKRCFVMRRMDMPFEKFCDEVSLTSAVAILLQLARGIQTLVNDGWNLPDMNGSNVLIRKVPERLGGYHLAIADFDLLETAVGINVQMGMISRIAEFWGKLKLKEGESRDQVDRIVSDKLLSIDEIVKRLETVLGNS